MSIVIPLKDFATIRRLVKEACDNYLPLDTKSVILSISQPPGHGYFVTINPNDPYPNRMTIEIWKQNGKWRWDKT